MHKYIVEAIGTFFLVLTVGLTATTTGAIHALAIGSALMVMIYAGAHISGAHYNPAVTVAVWLRGRLITRHVAPYIIAQLLGAALAAITVLYIKPATVHFAPAPINVAPTLLAEFLFTFALIWVILNVATTAATAGNSYFGLAIGFTVLAGAFSVAHISGAAFNPAVALGLSEIGLLHWSNLWIYLVGNLGGAVAAAYTFLYIDAEVKSGDSD